MRYVTIVLTTDKRLYIAPPWSVKPGDIVGVTTRLGEKVLKTVELTMTEEHGGEVMQFLERMVGCELKRVDARYIDSVVTWPEDENDVHE